MNTYKFLIIQYLLKEMDQIEIKIEEVLKEMNMLKSDNSNLKLSE